MAKTVKQPKPKREKPKLDSDDLLMLAMFQNIPARRNSEAWHRACLELQMKMLGVGDTGIISDADWDQMRDYIDLHAQVIQRDNQMLLEKYP